MTSAQNERSAPAVHPVQAPYGAREPIVVRTEVTLAAYEVYCHVYGPQADLVTGGCRGGFGVGELIAFLYARSFPKDQWRSRTYEALEGMKGLTP